MFVRDVVRVLEERGVPYCVVGGLAVNLHGIPRSTFDVDIVVPTDAATLRGCREALESIAVTFTDPSDPLREVDVLVVPPVPPLDLVRRSPRLEGAEIALQVVSLEDLADVAHLERLMGTKVAP